MLRLWRFCDHRVFMMSRVVGVAAVGEVVLFGLGGVLAGVEWWAMRGVALVGLTREQGGAGVGVLPLRARGCLRFGGMGFGRFGWGGLPPRTREPPDVLVAHQPACRTIPALAGTT